MLPRKAQIIKELQRISKKWFTSRDDSLRLYELLRELAHLDGYCAPSAFDERAYGLEEIARMESPEAVSLLIDLWKQQIGVTHEEVVYLLEGMLHPSAVEGLKKLTRMGSESERQSAIEALRRKTGRT
jgi:hypothetical protein